MLSATPIATLGLPQELDIASGVTSVQYIDADGDVVEISISGAAGKLQLSEALNDGYGNDDGVLEDGEELGLLTVTGAAGNFSITVTHRSDLGLGNGRIHIGRIDAAGQSIYQIATVDGPDFNSYFYLEGFRADELSVNGSVRVDQLGYSADVTAVQLNRLHTGATLAVADYALGNIEISKHLAGLVQIGGNYWGDVNVVGVVYQPGILSIGRNWYGSYNIAGIMAGEMSVGGTWYGDLSATDNVHRTSRVSVGVDWTGDLQVTDAFHAQVNVQGQWSGAVDIGGSFGSYGLLRTGKSLVGLVTVHDSFHGDVWIGGRAYSSWSVGGVVSAFSSLFARDGWTRFQAAGSFFAAISSSLGALQLEVDGSVGSTAMLNAQNLTMFVGETFYGRAGTSGLLYLGIVGVVAPEATLIGGQTSIVESQAPNALLLDDSTGFVINRSGTYRLTRDITYSELTGAAVTIAADNVTLDLAGHTIRGTAGSMSRNTGIVVNDRTNVRITNGTVSGFQRGIQADGIYGHSYTVDHVRAENNWYLGIWVAGTRSRVNYNQIVGTGALTIPGYTIPISMRLLGAGFVAEKNIIAKMRRSSTNVEMVGIHVDAAPISTLLNNIIDLRDPKMKDSYSIWVNAGKSTRESYGITDVLFEHNLITSTEWGLVSSYAKVKERRNSYIAATYPLSLP